MARVADVKCVVVGDGEVGKTCLLLSYVQNVFLTNHIPTVFDNYEVLQVVDDATVRMQLWDTAGQEDYDRLRVLSFPDTDVFLVCFSVVDRVSFENVAIKWLPEIKLFCSNAPIVLVGTKSDIREVNELNGEICVKRAEIESFVKEKKIAKYVECSARTQENLSSVFDEAVRAAFKMNFDDSDKLERSKGCCSIL